MRGASSAGTKNTRKISALEDSSEKETITGKSGFFSSAATSKRVNVEG